VQLLYNTHLLVLFLQLPSSSKSNIKQETDGTQQLEIRNIDHKDEGLYTCKAKTKAGEILRTDAKLVIKGRLQNYC
jgi:hypothetical protein